MRASAIGRRLAGSASRTAPFAGFVDLLDRVDRPSPQGLTVLMYHRVADPGEDPDLDPSLLSATPEAFDEQMAFLAGNREVLSLADLLEARRTGLQVPPRAVMVTFDDGYHDFARNAWPVLRRHGIPVTLFVATAYPDHPERTFWWDKLHHAFKMTGRRSAVETPVGPLPLDREDLRSDAFRQVRTSLKRMPHHDAMVQVDRICDDLGAGPMRGSVLGWQDLRRLVNEGVSVAPHSRHHPLLDRLPLEEVRAEVEGSVRDLQRNLGSSPPVFAYPAGGHTDDVVRIVAGSGMELAFTIVRGGNDLRSPDWLRMRRVNVGRRTNLPVLRAQLLSLPLRLSKARASMAGLRRAVDR